MTKQEAIAAMQNGNKVTHRYFSSEEWITIEDGRILTEDGYRTHEYMFWSDRTSPFWDNDWKLWEYATK